MNSFNLSSIQKSLKCAFICWLVMLLNSIANIIAYRNIPDVPIDYFLMFMIPPIILLIGLCFSIVKNNISLNMYSIFICIFYDFVTSAITTTILLILFYICTKKLYNLKYFKIAALCAGLFYAGNYIYTTINTGGSILKMVLSQPTTYIWFLGILSFYLGLYFLGGYKFPDSKADEPLVEYSND